MFAKLPSAVLFFSLLASCAGTQPDTEPGLDDPGFAAMPMGEMTPTPAPMACMFCATTPIEHRWSDTEGNEWEAQLIVHCGSDVEHEAMAHACLQANWPQAHLRCCELLIAATAEPNPEAMDQLNEQLIQELNNVLFPCELQDPVGKVTRVEWKSVTMRRRGHGVRHQVVQPQK